MLLGEETNRERRLCALALGWSFFILTFFFFFFLVGTPSVCEADDLENSVFVPKCISLKVRDT